MKILNENVSKNIIESLNESKLNENSIEEFKKKLDDIKKKEDSKYKEITTRPSDFKRDGTLKKKKLAESKFEIKFSNYFSDAKICDWEAESAEKAVEEFLNSNPNYKNKGKIVAIPLGEKLTEEYSDEIGGDPEDYISDLEELRTYIDTFDMSKFGTHLASQMVMDLVEAINKQIEYTKTKYDL